MDNCSAHVKALDDVKQRLTNVQAWELPDNCTAKLQPIDSGAIRSFKCAYRTQLLQHVVADLNAGKGMPKVNVKDAIFMEHSVWAEVSPFVIQKCFRKAGFTLNNEASEKGTVCFPLATVLKRQLEWQFFATYSTVQCTYILLRKMLITFHAS